MKKKSIFITGIFIAVFVLSTAFAIRLTPCSLNLQDEIDVEEFNSVGIAINGKVFVELGDECSLRIDADEETLDRIDVKVEGGKLLIKKKDKIRKISSDVRIYIVAPDYEEIAIAGNAEVYAEKVFKVDDIRLKISGNGDMQFSKFSVENVKIKIAGSGNVMLKGKGGSKMDLSIAGSGDLEAVDFVVGEFNAKISGSGDCRVYVNDYLSASIAGSGNILYKGSPKVKSSIAGSGKIKAME